MGKSRKNLPPSELFLGVTTVFRQFSQIWGSGDRWFFHTRWNINIEMNFFTGENITTPKLKKGNTFTPRGIHNH